jgi:UDPglucose 6-dehydrogenase
MRYVWELKGLTEEKITQKLAQIFVYTNPMEVVYEAHAVAVLTEWDEFKTYDWTTIYEHMYKPAFVFDGRNILDAAMMQKIGFHFKGIGKG